ncbi:signaling lymphocytic activation molecule-like, partial [Acanthochromis polyacanthus]|uniref:signaling lymphocytic activation molecule-like n=1 Tax=Acanthochromis polyacanthus TaxID=80966 RepID=UPI0022340954
VSDVEASRWKRVIHKKVGDTVELSSDLPTEGVTLAFWRYGGLTVADKDGDASNKHHFKDRLDFNLTSFSLTVRKLTLQDSGDFSFVSEVNYQQRETVVITLQVHEPITQKPVVKKINSTHNALDKSCTILLECSASSDSTVTYTWTVGSQTWTGPKLYHVFKEDDGNTAFTCTVSNSVSEESASSPFECNNDTSLPENPQDKEPSLVSLIIWLFVGILVILLLLALLHFIRSKGVRCNRPAQSENIHQDQSQQHVYSSLLHGDGSVYETVRGSEDVGTGDGCDYEPMRSCEDTATGGPPDDAASTPIQTKDLDKENE